MKTYFVSYMSKNQMGYLTNVELENKITKENIISSFGIIVGVVRQLNADIRDEDHVIILNFIELK